MGNHNTAEFWEYDTRVGRRWNTDPVVKPWESSYACFANNPIWYSDVNGDDGSQTSSPEGMMSTSSSGVVVHSSKKNPEDEEDKEDEGDKKSPGGGGGGAGGTGGAGANSKHSVGSDQLRKQANHLKASGIGVEDNGGGESQSGAFVLTAGQAAFNEIAVPIMLAEPTFLGEAIVSVVNGAFLIYNMSDFVDKNPPILKSISNERLKQEAQASKEIADAKKANTKKRQEASRKGNTGGRSNQDVKGEHKSGGGKSTRNKHENANARRAREQQKSNK